MTMDNFGFAHTLGWGMRSSCNSWEIALSQQDTFLRQSSKTAEITGGFAMLKFKSRLTAAAVLALTCLANGPAWAASHVTYVSGKGTDAGTRPRRL
jgi:hypothetical protein